MPRKRLDNKVIAAAIRTAKARDQRIELWDTLEQGLCARVEPSGKVAFHFRYRVAGRQRRYRLGYFGAKTVTDARTDAGKARAIVDDGGDPQGARTDARGGMLLVDAFTRFLEEPGKRGGPRKPRTVVYYRQLWTSHLAPMLGRMRVDAVTRADVERLKLATIRRIGEGRKRGQPGARVANGTLAVLSAIMGAAERWGVIPHGSNPCRGVERYREEKRERFLRPEERAALEQAISAAVAKPIGATGSITPGVAFVLRLLMWTGARTSEITGLRWGMVDLEGACLRLPDSKTGAKVIPLGDGALELLRAHRPANPEPDAVVCVNAAGRPIDHSGLGRSWLRIRKYAGISDVRKHDLRHSFASDALNAGVPLAHVGAMLGHANPQTTARYAHVADAALRASVAKASAAIEANMRAGAAVVRLPAREPARAGTTSGKGGARRGRG